MKQIKICSVWLLLCFSFFNCLAQKKLVKTTITGIAESSKDSVLNFRMGDPLNVDFTSIAEKSIPIKNGRFKIELEISSPKCLSFYFFWPIPVNQLDATGFLIEPGDQLTIHYGKKLYDTQITGRGSVRMEALSAMNKMAVENRDYYIKTDQRKSKNTGFAYDDELIEDGFRQLEPFRNKLSPKIYDYLKAEWFGMMYYHNAKYIYGSKDTAQIKALINRFANAEMIVDPKSEGAMLSFFYKSFLRFRAMSQIMGSKEIIKLSEVSSEDCYNAYKQYPSPVKEYLQAEEFCKKLNLNGLSPSVDRLVNLFLKETNPKNTNYQEVKKVYSDTQKIGKGAEAFPFELKDTSGRTVRMSDFKGKAVLIDFMFTGCPGCAGIVPILSKVEEQFKGKNIAFLSISVSKTIEDVKDGIGVFSVPGSIQLYTNGLGNSHPIIQHYRPINYPQMVLIDSDGKLVTTSAPDPRADGGKALTSLLEETLNKKSK